MRSRNSGRRVNRRARAGLLLVLAFSVTFSTGTALAGHWAANGWWDRHYNYPPVPHGKSAIQSVFGSPCNSNTYFNNESWYTADDNTTYVVRFHKKLGGAGTPGWASSKGGDSTNLYWDIRGHIGNAHLDSYVKSGIWGYDCRYISGTTKYSTHAWGIAIDMNARYEHYGHCHNHTIHNDVANRYKSHGWKWGLDFCDAMHFQYATGY